ncbi:hypothetical protein ACQR1N_30990 [Bradyrhizobium sp. HKCCYLRH1073]|uniref:hypothetical protein n=1 Tax=unclassified Bradyrhizobium TaxID=2631580 RepID=UPI003EBCDDBD
MGTYISFAREDSPCYMHISAASAFFHTLIYAAGYRKPCPDCGQLHHGKLFPEPPKNYKTRGFPADVQEPFLPMVYWRDCPGWYARIDHKHCLAIAKRIEEVIPKLNEQDAAWAKAFADDFRYNAKVKRAVIFS